MYFTKMYHCAIIQCLSKNSATFDIQQEIKGVVRKENTSFSLMNKKNILNLRHKPILI